MELQQEPENLILFWRDGIRVSKDYEKLVTIGMRGDGDEPMMDAGTLKERMAVMERIISDQRQILADITGKIRWKSTGFRLYKEVQEFWENGINILTT